MSTNETATPPQGAPAAAEAVAKQAPTEQQASKPGVPKRFEKGQTVCNEKNDKGKLCNGHLKQVSPIREEARKHMRGDDLLYRCQTCGALYAGPPLGHVRDPRKQARYVQSELVTILEAAGGTLPAFKRNEAGAWVPLDETTPHTPAPVAAAAQDIKPVTAKPKPSPAAAPPSTSTAPTSDETPEQKRARIIAEAKAKAAARMALGGGAASAPKSEPSNTAPPTAAAAGGRATANAAPDGESAEARRARIMAETKAKAAAKMAAKGGATAGGETSIATPPLTAQPPSPTSGTDSSASADAHRPAAEAQAATGQASAAPLSPAAATASPAAGAETVADLAPDASTELTPGAPRDKRTTGDEDTSLS